MSSEFVSTSFILPFFYFLIIKPQFFLLILREKLYEKRRSGSYLLFFRHDSKRLAIDATAEDDTFGRLINHSSRSPNVAMRVVVVDRSPVIVFIALKPIKVGQEIQYDYGEKRKAILEQNPWLR